MISFMAFFGISALICILITLKYAKSSYGRRYNSSHSTSISINNNISETDDENNSCPTNKRTYNHADNVNLVLHKFQKNIFTSMIKNQAKRRKNANNNHNANEKESEKMRKNGVNKKKKLRHTQKPIYFVIHF